MVSVILTVAFSLLASLANAAILYVDPTAGPCSGTYSITARNCTGTDGTSYATPSTGMAAAVLGDTVYFRTATYATSITCTTHQCVLPLLASSPTSARTTLECYPGDTCTVQPVGATYPLQRGSTRDNHTIKGFVFDGVNATVEYGMTMNNGEDGIWLLDNEIKNFQKSGVLVSGNDWIIRGNYFHDLLSQTCTGGSGFYGIYYTKGNNGLIEHNTIERTTGGGIQLYNQASSNITIRYNIVRNAGKNCPNLDSYGVVVQNMDDVQIYGNVFYDLGVTGTGGVVGIRIKSGTDRAVVYGNTVYSVIDYGIWVDNSGATGTIIQNNISVENGSNLVNAGTGTVITTNKTTGVITDYTVSSSDFTLKSGSPCINFGTARSGFLYSGASPDCGAFESFTPVTATINGHSLDVTFDAVNTPMVASTGNVGWSVSCSPSCGGAPVVDSVQPLSGSASVLRADIGGISGTNCAAGKTWTVTFSATTGTLTDSTLAGNVNSPIYRNQRGFSFTSFPVTNNCSGTPTGYPGTPYIYYNMNDGNGTTLVNSGSGGAGLNGSVNGATWGTGHTGSGVVTAAGSSQYIGIPYGNGINPTTQNFTIAFAVKVTAGTENTARGEVGVSVGSSQRWHVQSASGTWRLGLQGSSANTPASNHAVHTDWNHLCITNNAGTDTATIYLNGVAGTGGAQKTATSSYVLTSNFTLGLYDINTAPGGTYDEFLLYQSVEDCAAIYAAFAPPSAITGVFAQAATRFQGVHLDTSLAPFDFGTAINQSQEVVANGAAAVILQIHCQAGVDCEPSLFPLQYAVNGSSSWADVPDAETSDGIWMWGASRTGLNNGATSTRLTGSCAVTNGSTVLLSTQIPTVDLPADGCVMLRYIVRVGSTVGNYYDLRVRHVSGLAFTGGYQLARLTIVNPRASGIGF